MAEYWLFFCTPSTDDDLHLDLQVEGDLTAPIVDTGCTYSTVIREQDRAWGPEDDTEKLAYKGHSERT